MGLQDIADSAKNSTSSSSSSSSRSRRDIRYPELVIQKDGDGGLEALFYPETTGLEFEYGKPADHLPGEWVKVFWTKQDLRLAEFRVEKLTDEDLRSLAKEDPERAVKALRQAAQRFQGDTSKEKLERPCACCGERLSLLGNEYEEWGKQVVCSDHTITELKEADLV